METSGTTTTPWTGLSERERARVMMGLVAGTLERSEVARRCELGEAAVEAMEAAFVRHLARGIPELAVPAALKAPGRRLGRGWIAAASLGLIGGTSLVAYALDPSCATGLICFSAGEPATADDVNRNFKQLKDWLSGKIGPVDDAKLTVGATAPWGLTVGGATAGVPGIDGLTFRADPAAAGAASAWMRLFARESGKNTLELGVGNDSDDRMELWQGGEPRLTVEDGVAVTGAFRVGGGPAEVSADLAVYGATDLEALSATTATFDKVTASEIKVGSNQTPITMRTYNLGGANNTDTGFLANDWNCFIGGIHYYDGDINENQAGDIIRALTYIQFGRWYVQADFRAHNNEEEHDVGVVCVRREISSRGGWWSW